MTKEVAAGEAEVENANRIRFSVSLVKQGKSQFYTLTMLSSPQFLGHFLKRFQVLAVSCLRNDVA